MDPSVETSSGRVVGVEEEGIRVFRGIPYAAPPFGAARWRPPSVQEPWSGVRECRVAGPAAPQPEGLSSLLMGGRGVAQSEDCLTLNVWTPGTGGRPRPVMVWLHGGGFTTGSGGLEVYDGGRLARRGDVVVVTLNYRLGALGFLCLPELGREEGGAPGNFGLLDQLAALRWVRENAAAFGGDPGNLTLFGQSAGAMCAGTLLGLDAARGLFRRVILQSGAARNVHPPEDADLVARTFLEEAGVAPTDLAALRALPLDAVMAAQAGSRERLGRELADPPFQPCVDGALIPAPPLDAIGRGVAAEVELLVGTNVDEWRFYGLADPRSHELDDDGLLRRFRRGLPGVDASGRSLAERVVETYRGARSGRTSTDPRDLWFAIQTDRWFRHPASRLAELQAAYQPNTRAYLFTWASPALEGSLGSCHALEIPFVFGAVEQPNLRPWVGEGAAGLAQRMQDAWLGFARSGDPAGADLPAWPRYDPGRRATLILGERCGVEMAPAERERAFWDEIA